MATISMRIDDKLKEESREILNELGLDITNAVKLFLTQVVNQRGLPFELKLKSNIDLALQQIEDGVTETFDSWEEAKESLNDV